VTAAGNDPIAAGGVATGMATPSGRYMHSGTDFESEIARLHLLEARYDKLTFRRLSALGSRLGSRCLEVGAGAGSVVRWLSAQVGATGQVVATDLDLRFLSELDGGNVELRHHDIVKDDLEDGGYDLVHCRALLCHLSQPRAALAHMVAALRPGGWLLIEDADYVSLVAADPTHPGSASFEAVSQRSLEFMRAAGLLDPYFGRRVPGLITETALVDTGHDATTRIWPGQSAGADFLRRSMERFREQLIAGGAATAEGFDSMLASLSDPTFAFTDALSVAAWGRHTA
jgi:SAM-dependent methyltransferase